MGFWAGFLRRAGEAAHEQDLLDMQQQAQQKKDLYDFYMHLLDNPNLREERRGELTQNAQTLLGIPPGKKIPKEVSLDAALAKGSLLYSQEEQAQMQTRWATERERQLEAIRQPGRERLKILQNWGKPIGRVDDLSGEELIARGITETSGGIPVDPSKQYKYQEKYGVPPDVFEPNDTSWWIGLMDVYDETVGGIVKKPVAINKKAPQLSAAPVPGVMGVSSAASTPVSGIVSRSFYDPYSLETTTSREYIREGRLPVSGLPTTPSVGYKPEPVPYDWRQLPPRPPIYKSPSVTIMPATTEAGTPLIAQATPPPGGAAAAPPAPRAAPPAQAAPPPTRYPQLTQEELIKNVGNIQDLLTLPLRPDGTPDPNEPYDPAVAQKFNNYYRSLPSSILEDRIERIFVPPNQRKNLQAIKNDVRGVVNNPRYLEVLEKERKGGLVTAAMRSVGIPVPGPVTSEDINKEGFSRVTMEALHAMEQLVLKSDRLLGMFWGRFGAAGTRLGANEPFTALGIDPYLAQQLRTRANYLVILEAKVLMGTRPAVTWAMKLAEVTANQNMSMEMFMGALEGALFHARNQYIAVQEARYGPEAYMVSPKDHESKAWNNPLHAGAPREFDRRLNRDPQSPHYMMPEEARYDEATKELWWVAYDPQNPKDPNPRPIERIWRTP